MQKKELYIIHALSIMIILSLFTACSSDDDSQTGTDGQTVPVSVNVSTRATTEGTGTDWTWANGDQIGLSITSKYGGTTTNSYTLTYDGSSWATSDGSTITATLPATAQAWYPASASMTNFDVPNDGIEYELEAYTFWLAGTQDQSSSSLLAAADYMTTGSTSVNGQSLDLTLYHRMCLVTVKITKYEGFSSTPTIENVRMYSHTPVNFNTYSYDDLAVIPYNKEDNVYKAIVAPGEYSGSGSTAIFAPLISLKVNGITLHAVYSEATELESGKSYTFNLTVKPDKVSISSVSSSVDWTEDSGSYTGSVEIQN